MTSDLHVYVVIHDALGVIPAGNGNLRRCIGVSFDHSYSFINYTLLALGGQHTSRLELHRYPFWGSLRVYAVYMV